ncbi:TRAS5 protein [Lasius niger]|uniref:TRAS5 protein n=1 Tax=Lasius niger TaxID=67767 RepID=A0A0J7NSB9_LASNI|nr:TRAS5 protein [Lasius niger]
MFNDVGQAPTFWTARGSSFVDVTLASPSMSQFIGDWKVRCDWTTSDHNSVDIRLKVPRGRGGGGTANTRFDIRRADWERFSESLANLLRSRLEVLGLQSADDVEKMADTLTIILNETCTASMLKKGISGSPTCGERKSSLSSSKRPIGLSVPSKKDEINPHTQRNC